MATVFRSSAHWGAFLAEVENGRLVGVKPFEHDLDPSPMIHTIPGAVYSEVRVQQPMVREGWLKNGPGNGEGRGREAFVPVSWDNAYQLVAGELARVKSTWGNEAIFGGSYGWSSAGLLHHARTQVRRFLFGFGGCVDQSGNYSFGAAIPFIPHVVGDMRCVTGPMTSWSAMVKHAGMLVLFGGIGLKNAQVAPGGSAAHGLRSSMQTVAAAGIDVVNISPCRDDVPEFLKAQWVPVRPGSDTALMLALSHTLIAEGLHNADFLERYCTGFDRVRPYLMGEADGQPKDADWAAAITGVAADTIRDLARRMAATRTMLSATWSIQRGDHGEQPYWALILLASVLGQIGLPGAGFAFGYGSAAGMGDVSGAFAAPSIGAGSNPINYAIPAARVTDALLHPGETFEFNGKTVTYPDVKLIYWAGGNPFHHHQDINRLLEGWRRPETVIVHEPWWTPSARYADIVLPATTMVERNDIGSSRRDPYMIAMHKAIEPVGQAKSDYDIFSELSRRLGFEQAFTEGRDEMGWLRFLYDKTREGANTNQVSMPDFDTFWETGWFEIPTKGDEFTLFADFREDPVGKKLRTPSGRIELYSEKIAGFGYDDCPPHATWIEPYEWLGSDRAKDYPLHMVSNQPVSRLHSQMDCGPVSGASKVAGREPVTIHPDDAAARRIADGDVVRVFNDRGACLAGAVISDVVTPGVIKLQTGAWYDPADPAQEGALDVHGNANMLTRDVPTSRVGQGNTAQTVLVQIEKFTGEAPPVSAFRPPRIAAV